MSAYISSNPNTTNTSNLNAPASGLNPNAPSQNHTLGSTGTTSNSTGPLGSTVPTSSSLGYGATHPYGSGVDTDKSLGTTGLSNNQSSLGPTAGTGLHNPNTSSHHTAGKTAGAAVAGAALGEAASHHDRHNHPHHHEHTGHHGGVVHHTPATTTSGHIGHDPYANRTGPGAVGAAAGVGTLGGAAAAHHHHGHGHHGTLGATDPVLGTGLASGFAITNPINPATGAPDYAAPQAATIHDNAALGAIPAAGAGAATAATASKLATTSGLPKRVLMVLTSSAMEMPDGKNSGYHWSEVFHPYEVFKRHGYDVDLTSLTGKASPDYHSVNWLDQVKGLELSAMNAWRSKSHPLHKDLESIHTPQQLQASNYGIIYFTGGHATLEDFPNAEAYQRMAAEIYERNGVVCAVCHGVAALGNVRLNNGSYLLNGKQVTGFSEEGEKQMKVLDWLHKRNMPLISDYVSRAGGIYQAPNKPFDEYVVDSGRLITGPNPASAGPVAERAIRILEGR